ncbi:MAG: S41 family peptidase [Oscillospiraceae bacterium]|nr:S41 family peptidase [Oscillospiraceae bacterium]
MKDKKKKALIVVVCIVGVLASIFTGYFLYHRKYNGVWTTEGYGLCVKIRNGSVKFYEMTDSFYSREEGFDGFLFGDQLISGIGKMKLVMTAEGLEMVDVGAQYTYLLNPTDASIFERKTEVRRGMPVEIFAMFYEMFDENYAFESLYGADITAKYEELKGQVTKDTSDEELFARMKELISDLKDGHVQLEWDGNDYCPTDCEPEWILDDEQLSVISDVIIGKYAKDYYKFADCLIRYGTLSDKTGYIIIHGMGTESLNKTASTRKAMDRMITEFNKKGIESVAIELRFNGGGYDEASLCLAGYFTDKPYIAYKKQARIEGGYAPLQEASVRPADEVFRGDVYILTSEYTISAAETFLRAMLANPDHKITVVGERTAGFYSDAFERSLPGDFYYSLSNERYLWFNDEPLEGEGIEPDIRVPVSVESAREGRDDALDRIITEIG